MEDLILDALNQNPGITPEQLFAALPGGVETDVLRFDTFNLFRRIALDEEHLLPKGMTLKKLALLFDQLIDLAARQESRREASQPKEARHV